MLGVNIKRENQIALTLTTSNHQFYTDTQKEALQLSKTYKFGVSFRFYATGEPLPEQLFMFTFNIGRDIAVGLFSAWLYDKLKNRKDTTLSINGTKITVARKEIVRMIQTELRKQHLKHHEGFGRNG
jgi:hypothetical protein